MEKLVFRVGFGGETDTFSRKFVRKRPKSSIFYEFFKKIRSYFNEQTRKIVRLKTNKIVKKIKFVRKNTNKFTKNHGKTIKMITKLPWKSKKQVETSVSYSPKYNNFHIVSDEHYNCGQTLLAATFEKDVAPLLHSHDTVFDVIPRDGDPSNTQYDNMLVSGPGRTRGLTEKEAIRGNILRVEYMDDEDIFSYIYKKRGLYEEISSGSLLGLRQKVNSNSETYGLRNVKYLLTADEYLKLHDDIIDNKINIDSQEFDIREYKN